jgi:hypothetical protein
MATGIFNNMLGCDTPTYPSRLDPRRRLTLTG